MVAPGGTRDTPQGKPGRNIAGSKEGEWVERNTQYEPERDSGGSQEGFWRCWDIDGQLPGERMIPYGRWR